MNRSARVQCQPRLTRGLPLPAADPCESSRELLQTLALPDQRSSTDFNPVASPSSPLKALGRGCSSHAEWMHPEPLSWCWGCAASAGGCPLPAVGSRMHAAGSAENSGGIFAAPSSRHGWKQSEVCPQQWCPWEDLQCWEVPEHPPTASLLMGLFPLEGEEKAVLWLLVMEGSFRGGERNPRSWAVADSEPLCPGSCGCAYITALCSCSNTLQA